MQGAPASAFCAPPPGAPFTMTINDADKGNGDVIVMCRKYLYCHDRALIYMKAEVNLGSRGERGRDKCSERNACCHQTAASAAGVHACIECNSGDCTYKPPVSCIFNSLTLRTAGTHKMAIVRSLPCLLLPDITAVVNIHEAHHSTPPAPPPPQSRRRTAW